MRIFLFAAQYPIPYKPYYDTQFAELVEAGHDVTIFTGRRGGGINEKVSRYGLADRTRSVPTTLRRAPASAWALASAWKRPGAAWSLAKRAAIGETAKLKVLNVLRALDVGTEAPDLCLVHGLGTAMGYRWLREAYPGVPVAMYYHGGEVPSVRDIDDAAAAAVFESFDIVFTNTGFSRRHAIERGCPPERVGILPVGFALEDFQPIEPRTYRRGGVLRLLSAGRMSEEKGFIYALEALRLLMDSGIRSFHYSLTGQGYIRPELEEFVRANGLSENVSFLGTISTHEVLRAMAEADVLLLPSIQVGNWVENQACAVQEAMLMKTLVLTSQTGGVPESIPEVMRPFSVPERSASGIASTLERLHQMADEEFVRLGEACRRFVSDNYDIRELNRRMITEAMAAVRNPKLPTESLRAVPAGLR